MLNFLQQRNRKQIISEYLLRIVAFLLLFIFLSSVLLISLFLPSFFFAKYKNDTVSMQLESIRLKNAAQGEDPIALIKNVNKLVVALSNDSVRSPADSEIINKIASLKNKDIKILSLTINEKDLTRKKEVLINGSADTRDSLTLFEKDIKTDGFFSSVIFPVSNFIKSSDSEFSATLTI